jgi:hypothetical protein
MQGKTIDIGPFEYCKEGFPKSLKIGRRTWAQQIAEQEQHD